MKPTTIILLSLILDLAISSSLTMKKDKNKRYERETKIECEGCDECCRICPYASPALPFQTLPEKYRGKRSIATIEKYFSANVEKCESPCFIDDGGSGCLCPIISGGNKNSKTSYVIGRNGLTATTKQRPNAKCIKCSLEEINFCKNECLVLNNQPPNIEPAFCHYNCFIKLCM